MKDLADPVFTFEALYDYPDQPKMKIKVEIQTASLPKLQDAFDDFLRGAGFVVKDSE